MSREMRNSRPGSSAHRDRVGDSDDGLVGALAGDIHPHDRARRILDKLPPTRVDPLAVPMNCSDPVREAASRTGRG